MTDIDAYADPAVPTRARELGLENRDKDRDRSWSDLGCETTLDIFSVAMSASHDLQEHLAASDIVRLRLIYGNMRWQMSQRHHVPKRRETLMHTRIGVGGLDLLCDMRQMFYNEGKTHDAVDALRILAIMIQQYMRVDTADSRQNPFLILTGPPGQGKTDMISMMMKLLTQSQESKAYAGDAYAEQWDMKNSVSQQAMNYEGDLRKKAAERGGTPTTLRDNSYLSTIFPDLNPDQFNVSEFVVHLQALITEWGTDRITTHRNEASGELGCIRHRTVGFSRPQIVCCNLPEENLVGGEGASRGNGGVPEAILDRADKCRVGSIPQVPYPTLVEGAERTGGAFEVGHEVTSKTMLSNYMETALSEDHTGDLLRQEHERCVRGLGFVPAAIHYVDHHMTTLRKMNDPMCFESLTKLCINALSRASLALRSDAAASGGVSLRQLKRHCSTMLAVHHVTSIVGYTSPYSTAEPSSATEPGEIAWDILMGSAPWRVSCATCALFVGYASLLHKPTQDTEFDDTIRFLLQRQTLSSLISGYPHVELTGEQQMALDADHTSRARKLEIDPHYGQRTEDWDDSDYMAHRVEDTAPPQHGAAMAGSEQCTNFFKRQVVYLLPVTSVKSAQANRLSKAHSGSSGKALEDSDLQPLAEMIRLNWRGRKPPVSDKASIEILRAELKKQQDPSPIVKVQTWVPEPGAIDADDGSWQDITNDVDNRIPQQERFDRAYRLVTTDPPRRCDGKSMGFDKRLGALVVSSRFLAQRVIKKATADSEEHVMKHGETLSSAQIVTVAYGLLMMDIAHWVDNQDLANLYREYVKALPACTDAVLKAQQCASRPPPKFTREFVLAVIGICEPFARDVFAGICSVENPAVRKLFDFGALSRASTKLRDVASKPEYEGATLARRCSDADLAMFPPEWLHSVRTEDKELGSFCIGRENVHCVPFVNVGGDGNTDCGYPSSGMPGYRTTLDELGIAHAEYESWCKTHCVAISDVPGTEEEWTAALRKAGYDPLKERKRTLAEGGAVHRLRASGVLTGVHRTCSELQRDAHRSRKARPDLAGGMPVPCLLARRADGRV
jgi:hypothetical protein